MKIYPKFEAHVPKTGNAGTMFYQRKAGYPTITAKGNMNNLRSVSAPFRETDNYVRALDAQFKKLPPNGPDYGPNQGAWNRAAAQYANWQLCGCLDAKNTGQKLHRMVNLNRKMIGLDYNPSAPLESDYLSREAADFGFNEMSHTAFSGTLGGTLDYYVTYNVGLGTANPFFRIKWNTEFTFYSWADPFVQLLRSRVSWVPTSPGTEMGILHACTFMEDGMPMRSYEGTLVKYLFG